MNWKFAAKITAIYIFWRVALLIITFISATYKVGGIDHHTLLLWPIEHWNLWDGGFFHDIAATGYAEPAGTPSNGFPIRTAFFPLYPFAVRFLAPLLHNNIFLSQLLISFLAAGGALLLIGFLIKHLKNEQTALMAIIALLAYPFSYFLAAGYSEALFLFLTAGFFYYLLARKNRFIAAIFAAFACATRPVGLILALILIFDLVFNIGIKKAKIKDYLPIIISPLGTVFYMVYLKIAFGNPLIFLKAQMGWRPNIGLGFFSHLISDFDKILHFPANAEWWIYAAERIMPFLVIGAAVYLIWHYKYYELGLFAIFSVAIALATGSFGSFNRFTITIFPFFFLIALIAKRRPLVLPLYLIIALPLLGIFSMFFTLGLWTG